jgi:hypothetical protein
MDTTLRFNCTWDCSAFAGRAIIGIGKVSGDESTVQTGSTVSIIGGAELFYGLGKAITK